MSDLARLRAAGDIHARVLELMRHGLKIRDVAALLGTHPKQINDMVNRA